MIALSCRDRHCPRCQRLASRAWAERQLQAVLPVTYYHLVFTLPHVLNPWVELHPEVIYRLLFRSVWGTLKGFGEDPKRLGGQLGMSAVLHTWGEALVRHVHLHCLVPGGAWGSEQAWHPATSTYLFPVRALARGFRGRMVAALRQARHDGELHRVTRPGEIDRVLGELMEKDWVVYAKPTIGHTETVVHYLARYSHRIAISDERITDIQGERVALRCKSRREGNASQTLWLEGQELVRRFLLHVLPKGLMRIRYYGFLANRCRAERIAQIRDSLEQPRADDTAPAEAADSDKSPAGYPCPECRSGHLWFVAWVAPTRLEGG